MQPEKVFDQMNRKLSAILLLLVERRSETGGKSNESREKVDVLLARAGLITSEIGALLGKTDRAVRLILEKRRAKSTREAGHVEKSEHQD